MPALFTSTWIRGSCSRRRAARPRTCSWEERSARHSSTFGLPLSRRSRARAASPRSRLRPTATTRAPWRSRPRAISSPIPEVAPVTTQTLSRTVQLSAAMGDLLPGGAMVGRGRYAAPTGAMTRSILALLASLTAFSSFPDAYPAELQAPPGYLLEAPGLRVLGPGDLATRPGGFPFPVGERLVYEVRYFGVPVGPA